LSSQCTVPQSATHMQPPNGRASQPAVAMTRFGGIGLRAYPAAKPTKAGAQRPMWEVVLKCSSLDLALVGASLLGAGGAG
jgi:hypothetical protein